MAAPTCARSCKPSLRRFTSLSSPSRPSAALGPRVARPRWVALHASSSRFRRRPVTCSCWTIGSPCPQDSSRHLHAPPSCLRVRMACSVLLDGEASSRRVAQQRMGPYRRRVRVLGTSRLRCQTASSASGYRRSLLSTCSAALGSSGHHGCHCSSGRICLRMRRGGQWTEGRASLAKRRGLVPYCGDTATFIRWCYRPSIATPRSPRRRQPQWSARGEASSGRQFAAATSLLRGERHGLNPFRRAQSRCLLSTAWRSLARWRACSAPSAQSDRCMIRVWCSRPTCARRVGAAPSRTRWAFRRRLKMNYVHALRWRTPFAAMSMTRHRTVRSLAAAGQGARQRWTRGQKTRGRRRRRRHAQLRRVVR